VSEPAPPTPPGTAPIVAPLGESPASASRPDTPLDERWHVYEANAAPWWIAVIWLAFFAFGVTYLVRSLLG
jgi:hypothetical protein